MTDLRRKPSADGDPRRDTQEDGARVDHLPVDDQLRQLLKLEAIGQLAGGIAHDFNNLLTVITGYAETLLPTFDSGDPRMGDVIEIRRAAERAAVLTQQLLAFSRQQVLRPEVVDINAIVGDIAAMIARLLGRTIECRLDVTPTPATVMADGPQVEQVLLNLAVNARDAMPHGGVLDIRTAVVDVSDVQAGGLYPMHSGRYVKLSVADSGVGMAPEVRARVFEPFFTTKDPGEATGIGLATVYGIVKQSGGFVFVDSEPGRGSSFDVYLPYLEAHAERGTTSEQPSHELSTILLVEDYKRVRELARKILARHGYRVLSAASGAEALALTEAFDGTIDVLLTDVVMAGISGPELANQLRPRRPAMAVIYMSGYAGGALESLGVSDIDAPFLRKPFTPGALVQKVREVLVRSASRGIRGI